jgi:hypothetical protein
VHVAHLDPHDLLNNIHDDLLNIESRRSCPHVIVGYKESTSYFFNLRMRSLLLPVMINSSVDIYNNNKGVSIGMEYIQYVIRFTMFETKSKKEIIDISIPISGSVLQTIKRILESSNQI